MTGPGLLLLARRWWWLVGAAALVAALVAWLVAGSAPKTYQAETKLLVGPVSADFDTLHASGELGKTYAELATSRPLLDAAARAARSSPPPSDGAVSATSNDVTRIVEVRVTDRSGTRAARLANALAAQLVKLRGRLPVQQADAADAIMRDPELAPLARRQRQAVRAAVGRLGLSSSAGDLAVVERAVVPRHPVSPRVGLLVMIAAVAGALAALLFASMREQLGRPSPADSEAAEAFDIDSLFEPRYGEHRGSRSDAVERWLDEVRSREAS
jgi:uncharacterized protein involved in exopolysaccharide biosynthesis